MIISNNAAVTIPASVQMKRSDVMIPKKLVGSGQIFSAACFCNPTIVGPRTMATRTAQKSLTNGVENPSGVKRKTRQIKKTSAPVTKLLDGRLFTQSACTR